MTEQTAPLTALLAEDAIRLEESAADRDDAIRRAGRVLVEIGAVEESYVDAMLEREQSVSTYMGEGVAIPHGTLAAKDVVKNDALCVLRFPDGVDWGGQQVTVAVGIAAKGKGHVKLLQRLATILVDPDRVAALRGATTAEQVYRLFSDDEEEE